MKIGIMGGTFDPIHNGHLMLAQTAYHQFDLDEVWFLPNGNPPHKNKKNIGSDASLRMEMVRLAIKETPYFRLEDYEATRENVSYSFQTMTHFTETYPEHEFYFIIGADSLNSIESWYHPEILLKLCVMLAAYRDDMDTSDEMNRQIDYLNKKFNADIRLLSSQLMDISSSELRQAIQNKQSITGKVPALVEDFIDREGLYEPKDC